MEPQSCGQIVQSHLQSCLGLRVMRPEMRPATWCRHCSSLKLSKHPKRRARLPCGPVSETRYEMPTMTMLTYTHTRCHCLLRIMFSSLSFNSLSFYLLSIVFTSRWQRRGSRLPHHSSPCRRDQPHAHQPTPAPTCRADKHGGATALRKLINKSSLSCRRPRTYQVRRPPFFCPVVCSLVSLIPTISHSTLQTHHPNP